ncbi:glycosyltransferase [Leucobacter chironomi]|uniref:glycosyltransferase n=1 Tax=Leucobacter chironomi TaxID=491918 RepID=UPI0004188D9C|nr:glycosyltransferase [Leucobacter chironomi]
MTDPLVDVTIAVHSATRPIARAVASVLEHTSAPVRVNVVAHNIEPEIIRRNLGEYADHPALRLLGLRDGIHSAAGPMNHGLARSDAPYVSILGSDDEFAPGAIDSWLATARETRADAVLARIRLVRGGTDPYPPVRRGRRKSRLDGRRDRLAYRSAPLGLIDRERFGHLRFSEGLGSGEDLTYSLTLWFTGERVAYDLDGPPYVGHDDADDRVTFGPTRPLDRDFAFLDELEALPWFAAASPAVRTAITVKLIRIHFFDAVLARSSSQQALYESRDGLVALVDRLFALAPGAGSLLSRSDHAVFAALRDPWATLEEVGEAMRARQSYFKAASLIPSNPFLILHAQAPFRTLLAGFLIMRRRFPRG